MASSNKLSLRSAILININIMLGSGIFLNTAILTKQTGALSALTYVIVGVLLFPLMLAIAKLWEYNKDGSCTFYDFGLHISPFFGFLTTWCYFIAKLCSSALGIHMCISLLQQIFPALQTISTILLDLIVLFIFTLLNLLHLRTGRSIQYGFLCMKFVPILFVILTGIYLFTGSNFTSSSMIWSGIPFSIPLALYAFTGFEATCSLSQALENPEKNGPKAIILSYSIAVGFVILFQFLLFGALGEYLGNLSGGYLCTFPAYIDKLFGHEGAFKNILTAVLHLGIASSSLGSSYGILYSNSWNLYKLASSNHIFGKKLFTKLNQYKVPYFCVIAEGIIAGIYLLITGGYQVPLQQVSALGMTIAYTFSVIALISLQYRLYNKVKLITFLSLCSCLLFIASFVWTLANKGISSLLLLFIFIMMFGTYMFFSKHEPKDLEVFEEI